MMKTRIIAIQLLVILLAAPLSAPQAAPKAPGIAGATGSAAAGETRQGRNKPSREAPLPAAVEAGRRLSVVLGRPTDQSVTLNLLGDQSQSVSLEYWNVTATASSVPAAAQPVQPAIPAPAAARSDSGEGTRTIQVSLEAGIPREVTLDGLQPGTEYAYRLSVTQEASPAKLPAGTAQQLNGRWTTARQPGGSFAFEIIGDSHPERPQQFDPTLYLQTLSASAAARPDFFMTIGDDFSLDTLPEINKEAVDAVYLRQRLYLSVIGTVAPLFLVNGNHEQASMANLDGTPDNPAVWAQTARNRLFPQPGPDSFYSGDEEPVEHIGLLRDYYAWTWGDALFVVIDPYWHSPVHVDGAPGGGERNTDPWAVTLGNEQYAWFRETLADSKASFKFVFAHHVSGTGRGGIERAPYYEWGGSSAKGIDEFASRRPGWEAPIHDLMARYGVTAFVQGHDHVFSVQELDGVAYVTLPQPADPNYTLYNADAFKSDTIMPNSGRVRFTVNPDETVLEYWREWLPGDEPEADSQGNTGRPAYRLIMKPRSGGGVAIPAVPAIPATTGPKAAPGTSGKRTMRGTSPGTAAADTPAKPTSSPGASQVTPAGELHLRTLVEYPGPASATLATAFMTPGSYYYEYGSPDAFTDAQAPGSARARSTPARLATGGSVAREELTGLEPGGDTAWRLYWAQGDSGEYSLAGSGVFAGMKPPGVPFSFLIEADPHLDENSSGPAYLSALEKMAAMEPEFIVDLGDTSMAEKLAQDAEGYLERNQLVRSYWDEIGGNIPFFMALGNHDGEHGWPARNGQPASATASEIRREWLMAPEEALRTASYGLPAREGSFAGKSPSAGPAGLSYSLEWGDALIIVLDPYTPAKTKPGDDGWSWTLGKAQYDWLAETLAATKAAYRFVFIHNLLGGSGKDARGGADWAGLYEWGGGEPDGTDGFAKKRPDWPMPVHDLLRKYQVDAVFHGHDHFYAREEKDGIQYLLVPQPALQKMQRLQAEEIRDYGYTEGVFLPSPGWLRVTVDPREARVDLVRATDGSTADSFIFHP